MSNLSSKTLLDHEKATAIFNALPIDLRRKLGPYLASIEIRNMEREKRRLKDNYERDLEAINARISAIEDFVRCEYPEAKVLFHERS